MDRRFPKGLSLNALLVFEVAARHESFTLAAKELCVTQVAVSKRISSLEKTLGFDLFTRSGRRLVLTDRGARLATRVEAAMSYLATELEVLSPISETGRVTISAASSISQLWLHHRLHWISEKHPTVKVTLNTTDRISDLETSPDDLSILYSSGAHPEWSLSLLFPEELFPAATPDYLVQKGLPADGVGVTPEDLLQLDCFDYRRANASWVTLRMWFQIYLKDAAAPEMKVIFSNYRSALETALEGKGVTLISRYLMSEPMNKSGLVALTNHLHVTGNGYYLGIPKHRPITENALITWKALLVEQ
jgi:DNA-binding transcriptional LysR family regulator